MVRDEVDADGLGAVRRAPAGPGRDPRQEARDTVPGATTLSSTRKRIHERRIGRFRRLGRRGEHRRGMINEARERLVGVWRLTAYQDRSSVEDEWDDTHGVNADGTNRRVIDGEC